MQTYFTFPDGGLRYDCPSCGQLCCRGKGFALGAGELVPLLKKAPALAPHLYFRAGSIGAVDFTDGCWFLAKDGNCALEVEHGRATKPSTCRLFPFNRIFRVGDVRIVDMNSLLCPLQAADGAGVRWAELEREIDEVIALGGAPLVDVPAIAPRDLPADWLDEEKRALAALPAPAPDGWRRVYDLSLADQTSLEDKVAPYLSLLAPSLRWNTLFRNQSDHYPALAAQLPRKLRALHFLGALSVRTGCAPSLRALTELWQHQGPLLEVLARWNDPVHMKNPQFGADVPPTLQPALGALLAGAFRGGKSLGDLVEVAAATLDPSSRPLAVALAASQLTTLFG